MASVQGIRATNASGHRHMKSASPLRKRCRMRNVLAGYAMAGMERQARRDYRATVERVVAAWRRSLRTGGIAYHYVSTATPFGDALRRAAEGRARLG